MISTKLAVLSMLVALSVSGCTFDSKEDLAESANIRISQAVEIAEASVPGIAVTAEIISKDDSPTYVVELVDNQGAEHVAYIDALDGQAVEIDGDNLSTTGGVRNEPTLLK